MKKMNAPVMETVRFTEDDVIVASGAGNDNKSMYLKGFGNGTLNDGFIRYNGVEYSGDNLYGVRNSLVEQLDRSNPAMTSYETNTRYPLFAFINSDLGQYGAEDNRVSSDMNGSYDWDSDRGMFVKR